MDLRERLKERIENLLREFGTVKEEMRGVLIDIREVMLTREGPVSGQTPEAEPEASEPPVPTSVAPTPYVHRVRVRPLDEEDERQ